MGLLCGGVAGCVVLMHSIVVVLVLCGGLVVVWCLVLLCGWLWLGFVGRFGVGCLGVTFVD